jgi:hypothetical protein
MSSDSQGEIKEGTVEEKKETITTTATKPEEPKRRVRRSRKEEAGEGRREKEQTMEVAKEKPTTAVPTIPKRLLNRIDKHDTYLANIQRDVRLLNRELKKLTTRVNRIEARLVSLRARTKAKVTKGSSSKKKKGRSKR